VKPGRKPRRLAIPQLNAIADVAFAKAGSHLDVAHAVYAAVFQHHGRTAPKARRLPAHLRERADAVLALVAQRHGLTIEAVVNHAHSKDGGPLAESAWCLKQTGMSFPEVALATRRRNHTTAMTACRRVEARFAAAPLLRWELMGVMREVMGERAEAAGG
jgi:hypothetical protein